MSTRRVTLVSFGGGNASTVTGPLEVLEFASAQHTDVTRPRLDVSVVTSDGAAVTCDGCVTIHPTGSIHGVEATDLVFLAGMPCDVDEVIDGNSDIVGWIAAQRAAGAAIGAVCPSQILLAASGMLDGRSVAMHWSLIDEVRERWPRVRWTADRMVVEDQGIYSCCGANAAIDLALYIVERYCGRDAMTACAQWFLTDLPRVRQKVPPPVIGHPNIDNPEMKGVEAWILGHFTEPVQFDRLARRFGMSLRTFYRRFQEAFGDSPKVYLQKLRLNAARRLLENDTRSIDQIARQVGYGDAAFFRALFKRHTGMTPSSYRDSFRYRLASERATRP